MLDLEAWGKSRSANDLDAFSEIAIFGATPAAVDVLNYLVRKGRKPAFFSDNSAAKLGKDFQGYPIANAQEAAQLARRGGAVVIASAYQQDIAKQLIEQLDTPPSAVFPYISDMFASHFGAQAIAPFRTRIETVITRAADEASHDYLAALVKFRWTMDPRDIPRNANVTGFYQYAGNHPQLPAIPHIVDCGAFTGDTAEAYLSRCNGAAHVTAIEPMPENFRQLVNLVRSKGWTAQVRPIHAAVGAARGNLSIRGSTQVADARACVTDRAGQDAITVPVIALDDLFTDGQGAPDLIKIDIEGFELEALMGASKTILSASPQLAVAAYHRPAHLWEIPEAIWALDPQYKIFAGHHPSAHYEVEYYCARQSDMRSAA